MQYTNHSFFVKYKFMQKCTDQLCCVGGVFVYWLTIWIHYVVDTLFLSIKCLKSRRNTLDRLFFPFNSSRIESEPGALQLVQMCISFAARIQPISLLYILILWISRRRLCARWAVCPAREGLLSVCGFWGRWTQRRVIGMHLRVATTSGT